MTPSPFKRALLVFLAGIVLGAGLGLYLGWVAVPVRLVDVVPGDLEAPYQEDYLRLIAATYQMDGNQALAQSRVLSLNRSDWRGWILQEAVDAVLTDPAGLETRQLVLLADALGIESPAFAPYLGGQP